MVKSQYNFVLEKHINKPVVLILFALSKLLDYITTAVGFDLGFSEQKGNFLFYGLDSWMLFWIIHLIIFFSFIFVFYAMYKILNKEQYKWLKVIPILAYWSLFIISWAAPINNAIRIMMLVCFNTLILFDLYFWLYNSLILILLTWLLLDFYRHRIRHIG